MKKYSLQRVGNLFLTRGAVKGPQGIKVMTLLVDTGSTYTILPVEVLESIGQSPVEDEERVTITTGSGTIIAPKVEVEWFQALGCKITDIHVVAHTLPSMDPIDGLLGMDFLLNIKARLDLDRGSVEIPQF